MPREWQLEVPDVPLIAIAPHNGHYVRPQAAMLMAIDDETRLREEDPFTGEWAGGLPGTAIIGRRSRFEVDLNRPREKAIYIQPGDAWNLLVWHRRPPRPLILRSRGHYDRFYRALRGLLEATVARHGQCVVYDIHSYNHRRGGPTAPPDDPELNPQVIVGTRHIDRAYWTSVVDAFIGALVTHDFRGGQLDVRENIKFGGGHLVRWIEANFHRRACPIAIEFRKDFMDEWSGVPDREAVDAVGEALRATVDPALQALEAMGESHT
ncbi:MAG: N-formylglutamate amidohydrolase [Armatimonadia bacterium]|nr:N-formylglutamate amidohydrolase [Armatimonadia bacterium]